MFDVVRGRSSAPTRLRPALALSLLAHAVLLAGALALSRPTPPRDGLPPVRWIPRGPIASGGGSGQKPGALPPRARRPVRPGTARPVEVARPTEPPPPPVSTEGLDGNPQDGPGGPTGDGRGPGGGPECATPPCGGDGPGAFSEDVVAQMPVLLSGPGVMLSAEARRSGVEGTLLARCVITASGTVEGCEVLRGLPLAEAAVLAALQARRYRPAQIEGRAVSVHHLFTVRIERAR